MKQSERTIVRCETFLRQRNAVNTTTLNETKKTIEFWLRQMWNADTVIWDAVGCQSKSIVILPNEHSRLDSSLSYFCFKTLLKWKHKKIFVRLNHAMLKQC